MAKTIPLGSNFYIGGYDLSSDVTTVTASGGPTPIEVTPINATGVARLGGVRDGQMSFTAVYDPAALLEHVALSPLGTAQVGAMMLPQTTLGTPGCVCTGRKINYDPNRDASGLMLFTVQVLADGTGCEWGQSLTAGKRTDTTATNGTGVDFGTGSTTFGAQFYLQSFALTGTSCTVTIQESQNDGGADPYAAVTGGAFVAFTTVGTQRLETSRTQTVERYLRAVTTGTFTSATFAVVAVRNDVSTLF